MTKAWPAFSNAYNNQSIEVYYTHAGWYGELKGMIKRKRWHPDKVRIICANPKTAAREAAWLRKTLQPGRSDQWCTGEYVRSLDPIGPHPAGSEFQVGITRLITFGDTAGSINWVSAAGKPTTLHIAIEGVELQAIKLKPTAGGKPVSWLAELPKRDSWKQEIARLRKCLPDARRYPDAFKQGAELLSGLRGRVARLRPCTVITPELINGRQFQHVGLHSDLREDPEAALLAAAAAVNAISALIDSPLWP